MELHGIESSDSTPIAQLQTTNIESQSDMELNRLLAEFDSVFQEPQGLPLVRFHDHRIPLEPGTHPVVVRPYRYPHA